MRKIIWIMLAIIVLQACDQNSEVYNIEVSLDGSEGKWIKLLAREDRAYVTYDSVLAEAGTTAVLTKGIEGVHTMYLSVDDMEGSIRLLVDNSNYSISGTMENHQIKTIVKMLKRILIFFVVISMVACGEKGSKELVTPSGFPYTHSKVGSEKANPGDFLSFTLKIEGGKRSDRRYSSDYYAYRFITSSEK